jgi:NADP-dependent aldehyde dehydrogenase
VLLNSQLRDLLGDQVAFMEAHEDVSLVARTGAGDSAGVSATATLFRTTAVSLLADMQLSEEHFGPTCLLVTCKSSDEMLRLARQLRGQLTATIHAETADRDMVAPILHALRERAGRLIWNAFPTGVAVTSAMHHGGPFPASTLPAYSSVGMSSIARFLRPVAFQEFPDAQLPPALQDANPLGIRRMVNGAWTTGPAGRVV